MEDVLQPDDGPVAPEPAAANGKPPGEGFNDDLKKGSFESRLKARRRFNLEKQKLRRTQAKVEGEARFTFRKKWLFRRANVPPEILQAAIDRDKELKRLKRIQEIPYAERRHEVARSLKDKEIPRLEAKLAKLEQELMPHFNKVLQIDTEIRKVLNDLEFVRWWAKRIRAQTDTEINIKIAQRIKRIAIAQANQMLARQKLEMRAKHGSWGKAPKRTL